MQIHRPDTHNTNTFTIFGNTTFRNFVVYFYLNFKIAPFQFGKEIMCNASQDGGLLQIYTTSNIVFNVTFQHTVIFAASSLHGIGLQYFPVNLHDRHSEFRNLQFMIFYHFGQ